MTKCQQELYDKYINGSNNKHIIYNDGAMISFWKSNGEDIVTIHQSSLDEDNFVCIEVKDLEEILTKLSETCTIEG